MRTELDFKDYIGELSNAIVRGTRGRISPTWNDLLVLLRLIQRYQPERCLEIGVHEGHTASLLLEAGRMIHHYVVIDRIRIKPTQLNIPKEPGCLIKGDPRVTLILRPTGTCELTRNEVPYQPFDWVFIDAGHAYKEVLFDTEWAMPMLQQGGLMIWHDYGVPAQFRPGGAIFGMKKYLDELSKRVPITVFRDPLRTSSIAFMQKGERCSSNV